jgi:hypothetical protein
MRLLNLRDAQRPTPDSGLVYPAMEWPVSSVAVANEYAIVIGSNGAGLRKRCLKSAVNIHLHLGTVVGSRNMRPGVQRNGTAANSFARAVGKVQSKYHISGSSRRTSRVIGAYH